MIFTNRIQLYNKKDIHDKVGLILKMYAWLNINVKTCNFFSRVSSGQKLHEITVDVGKTFDQAQYYDKSAKKVRYTMKLPQSDKVCL